MPKAWQEYLQDLVISPQKMWIYKHGLKVRTKAEWISRISVCNEDGSESDFR